MIKKDKKIILLPVMLCVMFCITLLLSSDIKGSTNDIKDIYTYYFSYHFLGQEINILDIITAVTPIVTIVSMFADSLSSELNKNASYIFTRTNKKKTWLINQLFHILFEIVLINIFLFIVSFIFFRFLGYTVINFSEFMILILQLFITSVLTEYLLIIICNLVGMTLECTYGYITSILLYIISTLNLYYLSLNNTAMLKYIPFTQHIISIQDNQYINRDISYLSSYVHNYTFSSAVIYDLILLMILLLIGLRRIKKLEFY